MDSKSERVGAGEVLMTEQESNERAVADGERKLLSCAGIGIGIELLWGDGGLAIAGIGNHCSAAVLILWFSVG